MFEMKTIGKPCAGKSHARFEEEAQNSQTGCSGFTLLDCPLITQMSVDCKKYFYNFRCLLDIKNLLNQCNLWTNDE